MTERFRHILLLGVVGLSLMAGCATPPEAIDYKPSNELKPGPGIFTGEKGVYTIYGRPPSATDEADRPGEDAYVDPGQPVLP